MRRYPTLSAPKLNWHPKAVGHAGPSRSLLGSRDRLGQLGFRHVRVTAHAGLLRLLEEIRLRRVLGVHLGLRRVTPGAGPVRLTLGPRLPRRGAFGLALLLGGLAAATLAALFAVDQLGSRRGELAGQLGEAVGAQLG